MLIPESLVQSELTISLLCRYSNDMDFPFAAE